MSPAPSDSPRPRRRWLSVSLRLFMVLILVIACGLAWLMHKIRTQRQAIAAIQKAGGIIYYDWMFVNGRYSAKAVPPKPSTLQRLLGPEMFETVHQVSFVYPISEHLDNAVMAQVGQLHGIRKIVLNGESKVTGAMLASLEGLDHLEELVLYYVKPKDEDLSPIAHLTSLERLSIDGRDVTDAGMAHLRNLTKMVALRFGPTLTAKPTKIASLESLKGMTHLERLFLSNGRVTSIEPLVHLASLKEVGLDGNPIVDAGVRAVGGMKSLENLDLMGSNLTDAGVASIASSKTLKHLALRGRGITNAGLERLGTLATLESLVLDDTNAHHLRPLLSLKNLEAVRFDHMELDDDSFLTLSQLPKLKSLVMRFSRGSEIGMRQIATLSGLTNLYLEDADLSDAMMKDLPRLSKLARLILSRNPITDAGLANLRDMKSLGYLSISQTQVTSRGMANLVGLPLMGLHLSGTAVDDTCLPDLKKLRRCRAFSLDGTQVSEAGIESLKKAFPKATIRGGPLRISYDPSS